MNDRQVKGDEMDKFADIVITGGQELGLRITAEEAGRLGTYASLLLAWNERMNLTRITEADEVAIKHFVDSASVLAYDVIPADSRLIDVGTGAGFPGLVLKILRPDVEVVLLDSVAKRLEFLEAVIAKLGLEGVSTVHARAEDAGRRADLRETFDVAVARAVAPLPVLVEYLLPFVKVGGRMIAWKGPDAEEEKRSAQKACTLLGGGTFEGARFTLPFAMGGRSLVWTTKVNVTPSRYPRKAGVPSRRPLT